MKAKSAKEEKPDLNENGELYVKGYWGCSCHPFFSWNEEKNFRTQKLHKGDQVVHRCDGKIGIVSQGNGRDGFCLVNYNGADIPCNHEQEHVANLIKQDL